MSLKYKFASTIRCEINRILKLYHFVNYCFSKNNFLNDSIAFVNERSAIKVNISRTVRDTEMTRSTYGNTNIFFDSRDLTEIEAVTGCTFACICTFSCLQIKVSSQSRKFEFPENLSSTFLSIIHLNGHNFDVLDRIPENRVLQTAQIMNKMQRSSKKW